MASPSIKESRKTFELVATSGKSSKILQMDAYSAAIAFVRGEVEIQGDLIEAIRWKLSQTPKGSRAALLSLINHLASFRALTFLDGRKRTATNIRFHYDRSNEFYKQFLDERLVYSCAYFRDPRASLDEAQLAKLDHICRKLRVSPGDRFLDIGCGWGALVMRAAEQYGTRATGCTLSQKQAGYALQQIEQRRIAGSAFIHERDYRDMNGRFNKIASVGMFEHVGGARLIEYLQKVYDLLEIDGLFLNHGITRPSGMKSGTEGLFIARRVFPGGEIVGLSELIEAAEHVGFEIVDVENLRRHYALTCRAWVDRLRARREECLEHIDETTWRTWQLYLAGSAVAFEDGALGLHQVLMTKRSMRVSLPMTRDYMY